MQLSLLFLFLLSSLLVCDITTSAPTGEELAVKNADNELVERNTRQAGTFDCYATLYDNANFGGRSLLVRQQNAHFQNDWFNDRVESARIYGTCSWIFYTHDNFNRENSDGGSSHIVRPGDFNSAVGWGGSGNTISSARVLPPAGTTAIALFQHGNFEGRMTVLYSSNSHFSAIDFGDAVSSVIVTGGTWRVYEHSDYQGASARLPPGQYPILNFGVGNDRASSARLL